MSKHTYGNKKKKFNSPTSKYMFTAGCCSIIKNVTPDKRRTYYTVINTTNNYHRHYNSRATAIFVCTRAGRFNMNHRTPTHLRNDILYLMTGRNLNDKKEVAHDNR